MDLSYLELEGQGQDIIMEVTRPLLLGQFYQVKWPITPNKSAGSVALVNYFKEMNTFQVPTFDAIDVYYFLLGVSKHNSEVPSVIGFYRKDSQASVSADGSASRRNSELEMQHHASLNEADMENRRQKRLVPTQTLFIVLFCYNFYSSLL